jgi:hypothetical protein
MIQLKVCHPERSAAKSRDPVEFFLAREAKSLDLRQGPSTALRSAQDDMHFCHYVYLRGSSLAGRFPFRTAPATGM